MLWWESVAQQRVPAVLDDERLAQLGAAAADLAEHGDVVGRAEAAGEDEEADARLVQGILQLGRLVRGVDVDEDGADAGGGVLDQHPLVAVGGPDADPVAPAHAARHQPAGGLPGLLPEVAVAGAVALVPDHQRLAVTVALDRSSKILTDRLAQERDAACTVNVGRRAHIGPPCCL